VTDAHDPYQLYADELTENDQSELIDFDCGQEPWARAATEWLLGSEVWESIKKRGTRVWLYRTESNVIVGFGSLGVTRRRWPPPDGSYGNLPIIPMLGLDDRFRGQPPDPAKRYSSQIVSHLRYEAKRLLAENQDSGRETTPLLVLYVHKDNHAAIRLYEKFGFSVEVKASRNDLLLMIQKL
jgi:hypothetical protein